MKQKILQSAAAFRKIVYVDECMFTYNTQAKKAHSNANETITLNL